MLMKKLLSFWVICLISIQSLLAQQGSLVKDINVTGSASGFRIYESIVVGDLIYMIADDSFQNKGLWKSDGTAEGTVLVKGIEGMNPANLISAGNMIYFVVSNSVGAAYLWKSDGTPEGTASLQQVDSDVVNVQTGTRLLVSVNGTLYFFGQGGLMKTDGTAAGTVLLKPLDRWEQARITDMANVNGKLFLIIYENEVRRLYKSDGTAAGTVPVQTNTDLQIFEPLAAVGSTVYFRGSAGESRGLYKASNTGPVTEVKGFQFFLSNFTDAGNILYFTHDQRELWKSDGTAAGTVLVKNINTGAPSDPSMFTAVNGQLYFVINDSTYGRELWKSEGTASTTAIVKDIRPGVTGAGIRELTAVGSKVAFVANDGSGEKLWQSDGTASGTKVLADMPASRLLAVQGTLYFNGNAGSGLELFKSTMVTGGTSQVTDIAKPESIPLGFTEINGISYFAADDGIHGRELWKTDGTAAGTVLVSDVTSGKSSSNPELITNVNGTAFFTAGSGSQVHSLWKSNGTAATTVRVKDFTKADILKGLINVNGTLYFGVLNSSGLQLWKSNGTTAGTQLIKTIPQTTDFMPVMMNGQIFFGAYDGINSVELWKSNGTTAGTTLVKDVAPNSGQSIYTSIAVAGNYVYYISLAYTNGPKIILVKSDGTAAGTTVVRNIKEHLTSRLTVVNNLVYFIEFNGSAFDDYPGEELWRTDGTEQGTFLLTTMRTYDYENLLTHNMTAVNGIFYFVPHEEEQLWKSDGTVEGTQPVRTIGSMENGASIRYTAGVGNTLYFTTSDGVNGLELWKTQGTAESTSLAYDMTPNGSTIFYELAALNNQLLISADNGMYGAELFKYQDATVQAAVRINAGGQAYAASGSRQFAADAYSVGTTRVSLAASGDILNTTDDQLYKEQRLGQAFSYQIPGVNGTVNVVLHFAEIYWGVPARTSSPGAGKRRFNVDIEGSRKLTNYDIFTAAGGAMRAKTETFTVQVTDGTLSINFLSGAADQPIIAAIEVVPARQVTLGPVADAYVRNTPYEAANFGKETVLDVKTGSLPSYQRHAFLKFSLASVSQVHSAKLRIYGSNVQNSTAGSISAYGVSNDDWTETGVNWSNAPAGSGAALGTVNVNATAKYYEIDVTSFVQSQLATDKTVSLMLTNPANQNLQFSFNSRENTANKPQLLIRLTSPTARTGSEDALVTAASPQAASGIYPNPAAKRFTVSISENHKGNVSLQLISLAGNSFPVITPEPVRPASKIEVDISAMSVANGMYIMQIQSEAMTETVKVFVKE
ncbi:hypothetical protein GCM10011325_24320 [Dyadobacter sediminis]|uniref:DNRLRE domain-containing protein n=2 Tax=Dyadobacter sediminis TaxID=1493691 RepID=A0A5R9KBV3_9BACT|nr:DNRLRE domain-containing protein [Dyadobacter sediminis]GGB96142.1 hypothetical protein GCM10011325_24320 [Dyadobacter sediminis]